MLLNGFCELDVAVLVGEPRYHTIDNDHDFLEGMVQGSNKGWTV